LVRVSGVSKGKSIRYGKPFLDVIKKYVEENDIERTNDMVLRTVANKSNLCK
jgi:ATP-dependent DNA helicase RecQ